MNRSSVIAAVTVASLATAVAPAAAKQPVAATVCGATDCREVTDKSILLPITEGGPPSDPPRRAAGWYRTTIAIHGEGENSDFTNIVVPAAGKLRSGGTWIALTPASARAYARITSGLVARPAATLPGFRAAPAEAATRAPDAGSKNDAPLWPWTLVALSGAVVVGVRRLCQSRSSRRQRARLQHGRVVAGEDDGAGIA